MDIKTTFVTEKEIILYIENQLNNIKKVGINLLYNEEQYPDDEVDVDELIRVRNCIEWLIRINELVIEIQYSLMQAMDYAKQMQLPIDKSKEKGLYSYYLGNAVFRDITLWDTFRQLINEYFDIGYGINGKTSIYNFLKKQDVVKKIAKIYKENEIQQYLDSESHKKVRNDMRNRFTHSFASTTPHIIHKKNKYGKYGPQSEYILPEFHYDNICYVLNDFLILHKFIDKITDEVNKTVSERLILIDITVVSFCNEKVNVLMRANVFFDNINNIKFECTSNSTCEHIESDKMSCKPIKIIYHRINEKKQNEILL